nr:hypothetical protein [Tanacetum cinerariifolium]
MVRDSVQLEIAVNTISHEYLLEFTSEYDIPEMLHLELPGPGDRIVDFPEGKKKAGEEYPQCYTKPLDSLKNWNNRFFWVDERVFPTVVDWRTNASKDGMPVNEMGLFSLIRAPNPTKVKTGSRPRAPHEVPLLTLTASRVIEMDEPAVATDSPGVPSAIVKSPLDFAHEDGASDRGTAALEVLLRMSSQGIAAAGDPEFENVSSPAEVGSPGSVYRPEWGVTNGSLLDTPEACQDLWTMLLLRLRLRFKQEAKLLRKSVARVARRDQRIQARELEIKNLEARLEAEAGMKKAAKDKSAMLIKELEDLRAWFSDLQVEFKRYEDERVERRCAELDARLDALSIDFDEELYPRMLTAIAGRRQAFADVVSVGVAKGMSEGLKHGVEHGQAQLTVESIEAYDPEAEAKFVAALQSLKDLKYPLLDQLEGLKDAHMDVIMAALYLESDSGEDAPQYIRDLRPSSSQLTILVYPEVRDPRHPWAYKEEMKLSDAIAANITRAEKKKKCRIVCRTYGVGSAHHARSDGVPVSAPTVVLQGLALLLVDAATQTDLKT